MTTVITLTGDAAQQAQHLAAELLAAGIDIAPADTARTTDRSGTPHAVDLVVALASTAAYDVVKAQVLAWLAKRRLPPSEAEVEQAPEDS